MMAQEQAGPSDAGGETKRIPGWLHTATFGRNPRATLMRIAAVVVTISIVRLFILLPIRVEGISMLPTYPDRSVNVVNRFAYLWHEPRRGDVVSIRLAGPHMMYMKRIVGLPGETIAFVNGRVLVNGKVLDEPYEKTRCDWNCPPVTVGPNEYFVVGDNRTMPPQLHKFGLASRDRILGKLIL